MTEPDRLAEIEARWQSIEPWHPWVAALGKTDIAWLIAEVRRLRGLYA